MSYDFIKFFSINSTSWNLVHRFYSTISTSFSESLPKLQRRNPLPVTKRQVEIPLPKRKNQEKRQQLYRKIKTETKKTRKEMYSSYIYRMLKQVHQNTSQNCRKKTFYRWETGKKTAALSENKKKDRKTRKKTYSSYIYKVLKQVHQNASQSCRKKNPLPVITPTEKKKAGKKTAALSEDKKRNGKTKNETYSSYIYKVLKQVHSDTGISARAKSILNAFVNNILECCHRSV